MILGQTYKITVGYYADEYMCISSGFMGYDFKRARTPKTKIDAVRLPVNIQIVKSFSTIPENLIPLKRKPTKSSKRKSKSKP